MFCYPLKKNFALLERSDRVPALCPQLNITLCFSCVRSHCRWEVLGRCWTYSCDGCLTIRRCALNRYIPWSESGRAGRESESVGCLEAVHGRSLSFFFYHGNTEEGKGIYTRKRIDMCSDRWKNRRATSL